MPNLLQRQQRMVEVGRIRIGEKTAAGYPTSRSTFRFTSRHKDILQLVQEQYGGELRPWSEKPGEWELLSDAAEVKVLFSSKPRGDGDLESLVQNWERWAGGTCTHRCDGRTCQFWRQTGTKRGKNGKVVPVHERASGPCQCDHSGAACKPACKLVSRLMLILPKVPTLGMWRVDTSSMVFDTEIQALLDTLGALAPGNVSPLLMSIEFRVKRTGPDEDNSRFPVIKLVLDPDPVSLPALIAGIRAQSMALPEPGPVSGLGELPAPRPSLPPGAPTLAAGSEPSDDELRAYVSSLGEQVGDFWTWCEGEELDWRVIARAAFARKIACATTFWEGAEKFRSRKHEREHENEMNDTQKSGDSGVSPS
ncbi:MAG: hypothetical protein JNJ45_05480 [Chthonomonas sp.]|nr:hypothetical protein [Chthonomonas sp.]